jgi:hypothetical protein
LTTKPREEPHREAEVDFVDFVDFVDSVDSVIRAFSHGHAVFVCEPEGIARSLESARCYIVQTEDDDLENMEQIRRNETTE